MQCHISVQICISVQILVACRKSCKLCSFYTFFMLSMCEFDCLGSHTRLLFSNEQQILHVYHKASERTFSREVFSRDRSEGEKISDQVLGRQLFVSCCLETVTGEKIKVTILPIPNNRGAHDHWPFIPEGRQSRA